MLIENSLTVSPKRVSSLKVGVQLKSFLRTPVTSKAILFCIVAVAVLSALGDGPKKDVDQPEFYFTRLMYNDIDGLGPRPGEAPPDPETLERNRGYGDRATRIFGRWMMDTWDADIQYMWGIQRLTNVRLSVEPHPIPIMWPDLFKYPYIYAVEPGYLQLTDQQAARLREYLLRGGFLHVDDFHGTREWNQFASQMKKVFPEREIEDLPLTHAIFHTFFDIDRIIQVPNVRLGEMYKASGGKSRTWEQPYDTAPHIRGISDDKGRLMVLITFNSDYGDAWEWMDDPDYPSEFTTYAYRLGVNSIIYAMTH
jgi:uncharacterized protein DUF4159